MIALGSWWSREPAPLLGIDISATTLKLVELGRRRDGGYALLHCAIEPLEKGWIVEGNIEKFDEVAEAMRRLVRKAGTKTRDVALALTARRSSPARCICPPVCPRMCCKSRSRPRPRS